MKFLLEDVGAALYGDRWQSSLARALGVNDRTMRRWVAARAYPEAVNADLLTLVKEHSQVITRLRDALVGTVGNSP